MAELEIRDLEAGYGAIRILSGVSLRLSGFECLAVLGTNGSGKSTLAKSLMGLTTHHGGTIRWGARDITSLPTWRRSRAGIGYVPQTESAFASLDVRENLLIAASHFRAREAKQRLEQTLDLFPALSRRQRVSAGSLSGGERRMLGLAAALVAAPDVLILDEPTSDLAPVAIDALFEHIEMIRRELHLPILLVEQNVPRALELSDAVCVLAAGRVVLSERTEDVDEDQLGDVFLQHA
jgi:ABC-type branched-subunit amino acid transport system ATPase component